MLVGERADVDAVQGAGGGRVSAAEAVIDRVPGGNAPGFTTWETLQLTPDRMGVSPSATLGAGDRETDVEWLSNVGQVVAPENSEPSVLAIAHHGVGHLREDAVARFLEAHLLS